MLRLVLVAAATLILGSSLALAQNSNPKVQVFGGYSFFHADNAGLNSGQLDSTLKVSPGLSVNNDFIDGWNAEVQYNATSHFGVVADVGGRRGSPITPVTGSGISGLPTSNSYSYLFGPVVSYRVTPRVTPFVHALFGWDDLRFDASTPKGLPTVSSTPKVTNSAFTLALGGGIDCKLTQHASLRLAQVDYFRSTHDLRTVYGDLFGAGNFQNLALRQKNIRISAGIVIRF